MCRKCVAVNRIGWYVIHVERPRRVYLYGTESVAQQCYYCHERHLYRNSKQWFVYGYCHYICGGKRQTCGIYQRQCCQLCQRNHNAYGKRRNRLFMEWSGRLYGNRRYHNPLAGNFCHGGYLHGNGQQCIGLYVNGQHICNGKLGTCGQHIRYRYGLRGR